MAVRGGSPEASARRPASCSRRRLARLPPTWRRRDEVTRPLRQVRRVRRWRRAGAFAATEGATTDRGGPVRRAGKMYRTPGGASSPVTCARARPLTFLYEGDGEMVVKVFDDTCRRHYPIRVGLR
ncbi:hypothetical protein QYE76_014662 [Lolium multiflorum]|uniref:Uncharacterized protein n=1 Tax=Lolium multiflorum TaxID=4521 RepID=A0AAD8U5D6_LOLMU|nr:hypothetical protein QYE76_014662 [Lolium multiflorum]